MSGLSSGLAWAMLAAVGVFGLDDAKTARTKYDAYAVRLTSGDMTIDWREFRLAAQVAGVEGDFDWHAAHKRAEADYARKEYEAELAEALSITQHNLANPDGHFDAYVAYKNLGRQADQDREGRILHGLLNSIAESGDGKSAKTAWFTVAPSEEYTFLALVVGASPKGQALAHVDGHDFDKMQVVDAKGVEQTVWFNTDTDLQITAGAFRK